MKYTVKFLLESKNNRDGEMRIRFRVRWDKSLFQCFIPYTVNAEKWSYDTNRCKQGTTHGKYKIQYNIINRELDKYEQIVEDIFNDFYRDKKTPTQNEFKEIFNVSIGKQQPVKKQEKSFFDVFDEFTESQGTANSWTESTYTKFSALKLHLKNFDSDLSFEVLTESFYSKHEQSKAEEKLQQFIAYQQSVEAMRLTKKNATAGLRNTTIQNNIAFLKWFLRWSHNKGYYEGRLHDTFKPKLKGTDGNSKVVIYLTWKELLHLYDFDFTTVEREQPDTPENIAESNKSLERVRDVFCFCCFTSLRYSDVAKLKRSDITETTIKIVTKKTDDRLIIDLNDYSKEILDKYKNLRFRKDFALPVISNVHMNEQLKTMAKFAGINEPIRLVYYIGAERIEEVRPKYALITTHCGRRTFIVNALYLGIPAEVVMSYTGHSDYESMKPYISIVDELKRTSMNKFNRKTSDK